MIKNCSAFCGFSISKKIMKPAFLPILLTCFFAQTGATQAPVFDISDSSDLKEVVISATKFNESKRNIPNQISTIDRLKIERVSPATAADLLAAIGEIFVQKSQAGGGSPVLRGLEANRILLVLDGVRMNNAIFRGGHLQNVVRIDPFSLDRAEVVFGPGSLIYGSDALGGVLHFFTPKPSFLAEKESKTSLFSGKAAARAASANGEKTGHATLRFSKKDRASLTAATFSKFGDLRQGGWRTDEFPDFGKRFFYQKRFGDRDSLVQNGQPNRQVGSNYWQANVLQKFSFQKRASVRHDLNFYFTTTGDVPRYDRLSEFKNDGQPRFAEWFYGPETWFLGSYQLHFLPENRSLAFEEAHLTVGLQEVRERRHSRNWGSQNRRNQREAVRVGTLNFDAGIALNARNRLRYGLETTANRVGSTADNLDLLTGATSAAPTRYPDGGSSMTSAGFYLTDLWRFSEKMVTNLGVRYTASSLEARFLNLGGSLPFKDFNQGVGAFSTNAGLVVFPLNSLKISVLASTGFRAPNIDDLAKVFESVPGEMLIVPNSDLKPEAARNAELSLEKMGGGRFQANATFFFTSLHDAIVTRPFQFGGQDSLVFDSLKTRVFANQNAEKARIIGLSGRLGFEFSSWLRADGTLTWTRGRVVENDGQTPLDHIPPPFGRVSFLAKKGRWEAEVFTLFNGQKPLSEYRLNAEDNERYATADGTPGWWTLNFRGRFAFSKRLFLQVSAENLLDKNYRFFASGISAAGRNLGATLAAEF